MLAGVVVNHATHLVIDGDDLIDARPADKGIAVFLRSVNDRS